MPAFALRRQKRESLRQVFRQWNDHRKSTGRNARMSRPEPFVRLIEEVKSESWSDARGRLSFHTLVSGDVTPSNGLTAGVTIVPPGGALATHSHRPPEIYFAVEGAAIVTVEASNAPSRPARHSTSQATRFTRFAILSRRISRCSTYFPR